MSAWLSVPAALYVINCIGRDRWSKHNQELLKKATYLLQRAFGTEYVLGEPPAMLEAIVHDNVVAQCADFGQMAAARTNTACLHLFCQGKDLDNFYNRRRDKWQTVIGPAVRLYQHAVLQQWESNLLPLPAHSISAISCVQVEMGSIQAWRLWSCLATYPSRHRLLTRSICSMSSDSVSR